MLTIIDTVAAWYAKGQEDKDSETWFAQSEIERDQIVHFFEIEYYGKDGLRQFLAPADCMALDQQRLQYLNLADKVAHTHVRLESTIAALDNAKKELQHQQPTDEISEFSKAQKSQMQKQQRIHIATLKLDLSDIKSRRTLLEREREEMGIAAGKLIADVKLKHLDKLKSCLPKKSESDADLGGANVAIASPSSTATTTTPTHTVVDDTPADKRFKFLRRRYRRYTDADVSRRLKAY